MLSDYYQILGVNPIASGTEIANAFRQRAIDCHPDRGGSPETTKSLIRAFEILSDAEKRSKYDAARSTAQKSTSNADNSTADSRETSFIRSDFARAKHGAIPFLFGFPVPMISHSISGIVFIVLGAAFGTLFSVYVAVANGVVLSPPPKAGLPFQGTGVFVVALGACPGAWLAWWLHSAIQRELLKPDARTVAAGAVHQEILECVCCGRKLRVPSGDKQLLVTCPSCETQFGHQGEAIQKQSSWRFITAGYICGILALFVLPPAFALAGFSCGLVNLSKGRMGHGVAQIVVAVSCGILGFVSGYLAHTNITQ